MRSELTIAIASTLGTFALDRAMWASETLGFLPTATEENYFAIGVLIVGAASVVLWAHLAWKWSRQNGWGKPMGILLIILGICAAGVGIYTVLNPAAITKIVATPPISPEGSGGRGGSASVGGDGISIGGSGGHSGLYGKGGDGGSAYVAGNGLAAGGGGGSADSDTLWRPPPPTGYEVAMEGTGEPIDPKLRKFGRGGMSPGYLFRFEIVEKIRAEYFKAHQKQPVDSVENVNAVPLNYVNEKLAAMGVNWRARIVRGLDYEFFVPAAQAVNNVTVANSPGSIIAPSGGTNTVTNNFGPKQRSISDEQAKAIIQGLRGIGPHKYSLVDYIGGTDAEVSNYLNRLSAVLKGAGWIQIQGSPATFLPIGSSGPMIGLHFLSHSDAAPIGAVQLSEVLAANGVAVANDYIKFPVYVPSDDVIGIAVGKAPQ